MRQGRLQTTTEVSSARNEKPFIREIFGDVLRAKTMMCDFLDFAQEFDPHQGPPAEKRLGKKVDPGNGSTGGQDTYVVIVSPQTS